MLLIVLGGLACLYGGIVILVHAFQKSILWGLGSLFIPFVALIFVVLNWAENMKPFLIYLAGAVLVGIGVGISPNAVSNLH
jgi:hypothetical protein